MREWRHLAQNGELTVQRGLGLSRYTKPDGIEFIGHAGYWGTFAYFEPGTGITVSGTLGNVLRLQPPLSITSDQLDTFVAVLKTVLADVRERA